MWCRFAVPKSLLQVPEKRVKVCPVYSAELGACAG
jgi:hypothetical protein